MTKFKITFILVLFFSLKSIGQTKKEFRLNIVNPGIAWESPLSSQTSIEINAGVGYNFSYPNLNTIYGESGFQGQIAPFVDVQGRNYYNLTKRQENEKNSANFIALRYLYYGSRIAGNVRTNENYSMAIGPTWGLKREYNRWVLLGSIGPIYYFDLNGSGGFWPINLEFNFGYRLK